LSVLNGHKDVTW